MRKIKDLTGMKFGKLTVLEFSHLDEKKRSYWLCECDCEEHNKKIVKGKYLFNGDTKSCGCLKRNQILKIGHDIAMKQHNIPIDAPYRRKLYDVWKNIKHRCYNQKKQAL
jgi:hypothetical protein